MRIIVDTRERRPLAFRCPTARRKLDFGDYACELQGGSIIPVVFERKAIPDLFGSMSAGYERLRKCFKRAREADVRMIIVVEGSIGDVLAGYCKSRRPGMSVVKQLFSIRAVYDIETVFIPSRNEISKYIFHFFYAYKRLKEGK